MLPYLDMNWNYSCFCFGVHHSFLLWDRFYKARWARWKVCMIACPGSLQSLGVPTFFFCGRTTITTAWCIRYMHMHFVMRWSNWSVWNRKHEKKLQKTVFFVILLWLIDGSLLNLKEWNDLQPINVAYEPQREPWSIGNSSSTPFVCWFRH